MARAQAAAGAAGAAPAGPVSLAVLHRVLADRLGHVFPRPVLVPIAQASGGTALQPGIANLMAPDPLPPSPCRSRRRPRSRGAARAIAPAADAGWAPPRCGTRAPRPHTRGHGRARTGGTDQLVRVSDPADASIRPPALRHLRCTPRRRSRGDGDTPRAACSRGRRGAGPPSRPLVVGPDEDAALAAERPRRRRARGASHRAVELWELALRSTPPKGRGLPERRLGLGEAASSRRLRAGRRGAARTGSRVGRRSSRPCAAAPVRRDGLAERRGGGDGSRRAGVGVRRRPAAAGKVHGARRCPPGRATPSAHRRPPARRSRCSRGRGDRAALAALALAARVRADLSW